MKSNVNWLWAKFKDLPTLLKYALSLPIVAICFVISFSIAQKNDDAYDFFKKIAHNSADFLFPGQSKEPIDTLKAKLELPKIDSILAKIKSDSTKSTLPIAQNPVKVVNQGKPPIQTLTASTPININYKSDLKEINILLATSIPLSKGNALKENLLSLTKNQVKISGPEQTDFVESGANILKLPIENTQKRLKMGKRIKAKLKLANLQIAKNDLDITVLKIGKL